MHLSSMLRMKWFYENYCIGDNETKTVLDIGSYCCEGQSATYREIFSNDRFTYIGLDMEEGPNVNIAVKSPYKWTEVEDNFCDIVISGQAFEHIEFPWLTIKEISRVVKPNGLICIIAPNGFGLHRVPTDCWRYYSDGMIALAKWAGLEILHASTDLAPKNAPIIWYGDINCKGSDCMLIARKPKQGIKEIDIDNYKCEPFDLEKMATGLIPVMKQNWRYRNKYNLRIIWGFIVQIKKMIIKKTVIHGKNPSKWAST